MQKQWGGSNAIYNSNRLEAIQVPSNPAMTQQTLELCDMTAPVEPLDMAGMLMSIHGTVPPK